MSLPDIERAQRDALSARADAERTLAALRERLRPGSLAGNAWDGVKDKGADLADGAVSAVKARPGKVALALGAVALFFARKPLKRAATNLISHRKDAKGSKARPRS